MSSPLYVYLSTWLYIIYKKNSWCNSYQIRLKNGRPGFDSLRSLLDLIILPILIYIFTIFWSKQRTGQCNFQNDRVISKRKEQFSEWVSNFPNDRSREGGREWVREGEREWEREREGVREWGAGWDEQNQGGVSETIPAFFTSPRRVGFLFIKVTLTWNNDHS